MQDRAFRDHLGETAARHVNLARISSQPLGMQYRAKANELTRMLLTDSKYQLAQALELPTIMLKEAKWYRRLTPDYERGTNQQGVLPSLLRAQRRPGSYKAQTLGMLARPWPDPSHSTGTRHELTSG